MTYSCQASPLNYTSLYCNSQSNNPKITCKWKSVVLKERDFLKNVIALDFKCFYELCVALDMCKNSNKNLVYMFPAVYTQAGQ